MRGFHGVLGFLRPSPRCARRSRNSLRRECGHVFATVRDKDGWIVKNLQRGDFLLEEDGVQQTIRYFTRESDLPLRIGLLVDTSQSQAHVLEPERQASYTFLDQVLREGKDEALVPHFEVHVEVLQSFTSSRKDLALALAEYSALFAEPLHPYRPLPSAILAASRDRGRRVVRQPETGGAFFEGAHDQPIERIYSRPEEALPNQ
jgi:VWFA-related protein